MADETKENCFTCQTIRDDKCRAKKLVAMLTIKDGVWFRNIDLIDTPCGGQDYKKVSGK